MEFVIATSVEQCQREVKILTPFRTAEEAFARIDAGRKEGVHTAGLKVFRVSFTEVSAPTICSACGETIKATARPQA